MLFIIMYNFQPISEKQTGMKIERGKGNLPLKQRIIWELFRFLFPAHL